MCWMLTLSAEQRVQWLRAVRREDRERFTSLFSEFLGTQVKPPPGAKAKALKEGWNNALKEGVVDVTTPLRHFCSQ